jgi:hypothetical protein
VCPDEHLLDLIQRVFLRAQKMIGDPVNLLPVTRVKLVESVRIARESLSDKFEILGLAVRGFHAASLSVDW